MDKFASCLVLLTLCRSSRSEPILRGTCLLHGNFTSNDKRLSHLLCTRLQKCVLFFALCLTRCALYPCQNSSAREVLFASMCWPVFQCILNLRSLRTPLGDKKFFIVPICLVFVKFQTLIISVVCSQKNRVVEHKERKGTAVCTFVPLSCSINVLWPFTGRTHPLLWRLLEVYNLRCFRATSSAIMSPSSALQQEIRCLWSPHQSTVHQGILPTR